MARKPGLTIDDLVALGAEKLAALILGETEGNAPFKRTVKAALAGAVGPDAVAAIIDKRLTNLEKARGYVAFEKCAALVSDLQATSKTIVSELGTVAPASAMQRLLRLVACADDVIGRVEGRHTSFEALFESAASAIPGLVERLGPRERAEAVGRLVEHLIHDRSDFIGPIIGQAALFLAPADLERVDNALRSATPPAQSSSKDASASMLRYRLIRARQAIADGRGDVDRYIALQGSLGANRDEPIEFAERLLAAGRADEALTWVRKPFPPERLRIVTREDLLEGRVGADHEEGLRLRVELKILAALGDKASAQTLRWRRFETVLDTDMLREHVANLDDFEEFDVIDRAFAHAACHEDFHCALGFLVGWPRLDLAAALVIRRRDEWNGDRYMSMVPAADALSEAYPVAATILYRALIDQIVPKGRSQAYGHAARYMAQLDEMPPLDASSGLEDHATYRAGLRRAHGRKYGFWNLLNDTSKKAAGMRRR